MEPKMLKVGNKAPNETMPVEEVVRILERFAERVYVDRYQDELGGFLSRSLGHERVGMSPKEFQSLKARGGRLFASYSGPCRTDCGVDLNKQEELIKRVNTQFPYIDGTVHGATMAGFIKSLHLESIATKKLSIGVIPWRGLLTLAKMEKSLPADFPKMHYLAIEGMDYGDQARMFASIADLGFLLGGREGAKTEALAISERHNPVLCYDIESGSQAVRDMKDSTIVLPNIDDVITFLNNNMIPGQRLFHGKSMDFERFNEYLIKNGIVNIGIDSTSGAATNYPSFRNLFDELFRRGIPVEASRNVEMTSGGTRFGGVWESYSSISELNIKRNGIMSAKGLTLPWCNVDTMIYTKGEDYLGKDWGSESKAFLYTLDIMIAYSGGKQTRNEILEAAKSGGRYSSIGNGIPVIVMYDERARGATLDLYNESKAKPDDLELNHPNIHYFHSSQVCEAAELLRAEILKKHKK